MLHPGVAARVLLEIGDGIAQVTHQADRVLSQARRQGQVRRPAQPGFEEAPDEDGDARLGARRMGQARRPQPTEAARFEAGHLAGLVAQGVAHPAGGRQGLVEADGERNAPSELGARHQVRRRERLLDAQHVGVGQAGHQRRVLHAVRAVGVDLDDEVGVVGPESGHGLRIPARLDLDPHAGRPVVDRLGHLLAQDADVMSGRNSHRGADRERLVAGTHVEGLGQRTAGEPQIGVGHRHLEHGGQHPVGGRAPEELCHLGLPRQLAPTGRCGIEQAENTPGGGGRRNLVHARVDRGPLVQRGALPPPLGLLGHDAHEEQRPGAMDPGRRADGNPEAGGHTHKLDPEQSHRPPPPTSPR